MSRVRDRTEDLKDAVRQTALSLGYNEVCLPLGFISSLIMFMMCFLQWKYLALCCSRERGLVILWCKYTSCKFLLLFQYSQ